MWSDGLICDEVAYSLQAAAVLQRECRPLLDSRRDIIEWLTRPREQRLSCFSPSNAEVKSLLFEIRFALELHRAGATAEYEFATGVGSSSVDFRIIAQQEWLIELVSLYESQAIKEATWHREVRDGLTFFGMHLGGSRSDPRQIEDGEMIKAQERIAAKVFKGKSVIKFPVPISAYHLILVDARGYVGQGGECFNWPQMTLGAEAAAQFDASLVKFWTHPHTHVRSPVRGLFEVANPTKAAKYVRDRIHFIGFVSEENYQEGEVGRKLVLFYNPHLLATSGDIRRSFCSFPLARQMPQWDVAENRCKAQ